MKMGVAEEHIKPSERFFLFNSETLKTDKITRRRFVMYEKISETPRKQTVNL
jgi:hypothetical protein